MSDALEEILPEAGATLAYSGVGIVLTALGFLVTDLVTPGKLREQIWVHRSRNQALLLSSNILAVGLIVAAAIYTSEGDLAEGLLATAIYGVAGLLLMGGAFLLLDLLTPGDLGKILVESEGHPAVWVSVALHIAIAFVIVAGLS